MKCNPLSTGDLSCPPGVKIPSYMKPHPTLPNVYCYVWPQDCTNRFVSTKTLSCGKCVGTWWCKHKGILSIKDCVNCHLVNLPVPDGIKPQGPS